MKDAFYNMELKQFMNLYTERNVLSLGDDFCIIDLPYTDKEPHFVSPVRVDAFLIAICLGGKVRLSVNMNEFTLEKDQIALLAPGFIGQVLEMDATLVRQSHYVIIGMSRRYHASLHLDLNRIFSDGTALANCPCAALTEAEKDISVRYLELMAVVLRSELPNKHEAVASLISSLLYLTEGVFTRHKETTPRREAERPERAKEVFNKFIRLLADNHTQERSVGFYAGRLFLSPKYFSKLIKEASGRSAPEWIDSYVILEAKNYLKYSDLSIKQIVYRLHFADQPTFTKYFKSHTGLTPAQFRKR